MVSKDQSIGGLILFICAFLAIFYLVSLAVPSWLGMLGVPADFDVQFWFIAIPVIIAFVAVLLIGGWIGYTMLTTPPPKPIEELTTEPEEKKEEAPPAEKTEEEKKPEKKRKEEK